MTLRNYWASIDAWMKENASMITLGSLLMVIMVAWNAGSSVASLQATHRQDCDAQRRRFLDVANFWDSKSSTHGTHASHEHDASTLWTTITSELGPMSSPALIRDLAKVSAAWQGLSDDDDTESKLDSGYVDMLRRDFTASCGDAPTPLPTIGPTPALTTRGRR